MTNPRAQKLTAEAAEEFRRAILGYYEAQGRTFPWRETDDPWGILVSEFMLQQTQTARVAEKYPPWMETFPTAESLANASLAEVLRHWSGLGYNRRARFLQESAKIIAQSGFPESAEALRRLPGVGPYTASAVAAFAFNQGEVFIETNIRSVFIFFFFPDSEAVPVRDSEILPLVEQTLDRSNPRRWYYALKRAVQNPSRKSAHHARQSPFKGSLREARGAILRDLSSGGKSALASIGEREAIEYPRLEQAAASLTAEGFIREEDGSYMIV